MQFHCRRRLQWLATAWSLVSAALHLPKAAVWWCVGNPASAPLLDLTEIWHAACWNGKNIKVCLIILAPESRCMFVLNAYLEIFVFSSPGYQRYLFIAETSRPDTFPMWCCMAATLICSSRYRVIWKLRWCAFISIAAVPWQQQVPPLQHWSPNVWLQIANSESMFCWKCCTKAWISAESSS